MNCEEFKETAIKSGGTLHEEAMNHLAGCPECRAFYATLAKVETLGAAPSPELDRACLMAGRRQMRLRHRCVCG